jgi:hypothetical protein
MTMTVRVAVFAILAVALAAISAVFVMLRTNQPRQFRDGVYHASRRRFARGS